VAGSGNGGGSLPSRYHPPGLKASDLVTEIAHVVEQLVEIRRSALDRLLECLEFHVRRSRLLTRAAGNRCRRHARAGPQARPAAPRSSCTANQYLQVMPCTYVRILRMNEKAANFRGYGPLAFGTGSASSRHGI